MKDNTIFSLIVGGFGLFWVISALLGMATTGLIVYILYRVATHPW